MSSSSPTSDLRPPTSPRDSEVLVRVEGVSKIFCRDLKKSLWYGLQDSAKDLISWGRKIEDGRSKIVDGRSKIVDGRLQIVDGRSEMEDEEKDPREADPSSLHPQSTIHNPRSAPLKLRDGEFLAVDNVSFELKRGDCLGLIGRNGAGKTTLLKMLTGLIKPDVGRIEMHGRIGALIALGAGFNPILSGRENIYINGSILGLSKKEIDSKIDEIIDFAEINDFIDSPVQSYSSGMQVRLGFAVATTLDPDVLILDEVLAVGDAGFRHKCYSRIGRLQRNAAVIFVSHSMEFVAQICNRVLHLQPGRAVLYSDVTNGVAAYLEENQAQDAETTAGQRAFYPPITNADMSLSRATVNYGEGLDVCLTLEVMHAFHNPIVGLALRSESDHVAAIWNTRHHGVRVEIPAGCSEIRFTIGPLFLLPGKYNCSISVREDGNAEHALWFYNQAQFTVIGQGQPSADVSVLLPYQGHTLNSRIS